MAKQIYVGVADKARRVAKAYIGVDGVARKIKKAYIGIGGVARPCLSSDAVYKYGALTDLQAARVLMAAGSNDSLAIFAGGERYGKSSEIATDYLFADVDAYNASLSKVNVSALAVQTRSITAYSEPTRVLLFGGYMATYAVSSAVMSYNTSGTQSTPANLTTARCNTGVAKAGTHIVVAGGGTKNQVISNVDIFSASLTRTVGEALHVARTGPLYGKAGSRALFYGGDTYNSFANDRVDTIDYYDASLTHGYTTGHDEVCARNRYQSYNGFVSNEIGLVIDVGYHMGIYNESLTYQQSAQITAHRSRALSSLGAYIIAAGGSSGSNNSVTTVNTYDQSLTEATCEAMSWRRSSLTATIIGNFVILAGGCTDTLAEYVKATVEAYTAA